MTAEEIVARLVYRDGLMLVIDKPAGLAVHKGPKGGESLEDYFDALRFGLPRAPALAHRLDRDTSGCLVLGRHPKALRRLGRLFAEGKVEKTYWAVVVGIPAPPQEAEAVLPDLVIAPLLAFDRAGGRLGQGAGHYDRAIANLRRCKSVFVLGLAYAGQELPQIPMEPHDQRLDAILTETGYIEVKQG